MRYRKCSIERLEYQKVYYKKMKRKNPEKLKKWKEQEKIKRKIWRDKQRELNPSYCEGCKEKLPKFKKKWCDRCGKIIPLKKWKEKNKEKLKDYARNWAREYRKNNSTRLNEYQRIYRVTRKKELQFDIPLKQYEEIIKNGCIICGFKETFDIHHLEGKNSKKLVCLCPNHHQVIHRKDKTFEEVRNEYHKYQEKLMLKLLKGGINKNGNKYNKGNP